MNSIRPIPRYGYTTRHGRRVFGQDDCRREYRLGMGLTFAAVMASLAISFWGVV